MVDYFTVKASKLLNIEPEEVSKEQRQKGKQAFFAEMHNMFTHRIKSEVEYKLNTVKSDLDFIRACSDNKTANENVLELRGQQKVLEDILEIIEGN